MRKSYILILLQAMIRARYQGIAQYPVLALLY